MKTRFVVMPRLRPSPTLAFALFAVVVLLGATGCPESRRATSSAEGVDRRNPGPMGPALLPDAGFAQGTVRRDGPHTNPYWFADAGAQPGPGASVDGGALPSQPDALDDPGSSDGDAAAAPAADDLALGDESPADGRSAADAGGSSTDPGVHDDGAAGSDATDPPLDADPVAADATVADDATVPDDGTASDGATVSDDATVADDSPRGDASDVAGATGEACEEPGAMRCVPLTRDQREACSPGPDGALTWQPAAPCDDQDQCGYDVCRGEGECVRWDVWDVGRPLFEGEPLTLGHEAKGGASVRLTRARVSPGGALELVAVVLDRDRSDDESGRVHVLSPDGTKEVRLIDLHRAPWRDDGRVAAQPIGAAAARDGTLYLRLDALSGGLAALDTSGQLGRVSAATYEPLWPGWARPFFTGMDAVGVSSAGQERFVLLSAGSGEGPFGSYGRPGSTVFDIDPTGARGPDELFEHAVTHPAGGWIKARGATSWADGQGIAFDDVTGDLVVFDLDDGDGLERIGGPPGREGPLATPVWGPRGGLIWTELGRPRIHRIDPVDGRWTTHELRCMVGTNLLPDTTSRDLRDCYAASIALTDRGTLVAAIHTRRTALDTFPSSGESACSPDLPPDERDWGADCLRLTHDFTYTEAYYGFRRVLACDDGDPCTHDDACEAGRCVGEPSRDCVACEVLRCDAARGCSLEAVEDGSPCGADPCLGPQVCQAGRCVAIADPPTCPGEGEACRIAGCHHGEGCKIVDARRGAPTRTIRTGERDQAYKIAFAPDGHYLTHGAGDGDPARLWEGQSMDRGPVDWAEGAIERNDPWTGRARDRWVVDWSALECGSRRGCAFGPLAASPGNDRFCAVVNATEWVDRREVWAHLIQCVGGAVGRQTTPVRPGRVQALGFDRGGALLVATARMVERLDPDTLAPLGPVAGLPAETAGSIFMGLHGHVYLRASWCHGPVVPYAVEAGGVARAQPAVDIPPLWSTWVSDPAMWAPGMGCDDWLAFDHPRDGTVRTVYAAYRWEEDTYGEHARIRAVPVGAGGAAIALPATPSPYILRPEFNDLAAHPDGHLYALYHINQYPPHQDMDVIEVHAALWGDDGTGGCHAGGCEVAGASCDDANPCTRDRCTADGCVHEAFSDAPGDASCDLDGVGSLADRCVEGVCRPGPLADCDDGDARTIDLRTPDGGCMRGREAGAAAVRTALLSAQEHRTFPESDPTWIGDDGFLYLLGRHNFAVIRIDPDTGRRVDVVFPGIGYALTLGDDEGFVVEVGRPFRWGMARLLRVRVKLRCPPGGEACTEPWLRSRRREPGDERTAYVDLSDLGRVVAACPLGVDDCLAALQPAIESPTPSVVSYQLRESGALLSCSGEGTACLLQAALCPATEDGHAAQQIWQVGGAGELAVQCRGDGSLHLIQPGLSDDGAADLRVTTLCDPASRFRDAVDVKPLGDGGVLVLCADGRVRYALPGEAGDTGAFAVHVVDTGEQIIESIGVGRDGTIAYGGDDGFARQAPRPGAVVQAVSADAADATWKKLLVGPGGEIRTIRSGDWPAVSLRRYW